MVHGTCMASAAPRRCCVGLRAPASPTWPCVSVLGPAGPAALEAPVLVADDQVCLTRRAARLAPAPESIRGRIRGAGRRHRRGQVHRGRACPGRGPGAERGDRAVARRCGDGASHGPRPSPRPPLPMEASAPIKLAVALAKAKRARAAYEIE